MNDKKLTDSAGVPWAGRHFEANDFSSDDGTAPIALVAALDRFRALGDSSPTHERAAAQSEILDALRASRLLVPLVAQLGEAGAGEHGLTVDKSAELAIVTVAGPDGRTVLPVFSSVQSLSKWNSRARPVPVSAVRVALAAASENTDLVVLDPTSDTEHAVRRPALWALAQSLPWRPCYADPEVLGVFAEAAATEPDVQSVTLEPGDPTARLAGPELVARIELKPGLSKPQLDELLSRQQTQWSASDIIAQRVDSLAVRLVAAH